jgi:hypothetical protein
MHFVKKSLIDSPHLIRIYHTLIIL